MNLVQDNYLDSYYTSKLFMLIDWFAGIGEWGSCDGIWGQI